MRSIPLRAQRQHREGEASNEVQVGDQPSFIGKCSRIGPYVAVSIEEGDRNGLNGLSMH